MTQLIAVFGASPGIGKSTLVRRLAADVPATARVDRFDEEDVLSRLEFCEVATQFRATRNVDLDTLLDASARFVVSAREYDVVITDALFPFVPSLLAWGHDEAAIRAFLVRLRAILQPLHPVVVYLDGDPGEALPRAASRSGAAWLTAFLDKVATYKRSPTVEGLSATVEYLRHERDMTLRTMADAGYRVVVLTDAHQRTPDELGVEARERIAAVGSDSYA